MNEEDERCIQCGHTQFKVGDSPDVKDPMCPECSRTHPDFDGWDCKNCGHSMPDKARKAHGRLVTGTEAEEILRQILGE